MIILTIILFALAATLGLGLISYVLTNKNTPKGVAIIHGTIGASAIVLLLLYVWLYSPGLYLSLIFFVLAALGGFTLIYRDLTGKSLPKWLALGHGLLAVIGFILLLIFVFYSQ